jgi:hypothetical protein
MSGSGLIARSASKFQLITLGFMNLSETSLADDGIDPTQSSLLKGSEPHPVIKLATPEQIACSGIDPLAYYRKRADSIRLMSEEPLLFGYEPAIWKEADKQVAELRSQFPSGVITLLILGGNRGSKTVYAAKRFMQTLTRSDNKRGWCLQSTEAASRADQQPVVYEYIPSNLKPESGRLRGGRTTKIVYSRSGGFTENTFVLPNGSQAWFKFYGANVKTLEGAELDIAWADELIQPDWVEAIRFRLLNRNGLFLITFTPIDGYTGTVKEFLDGATTLEWGEAPLLLMRDGKKFEKVPRVQKSGKSTARIVYFHTSDNAFGNYPAMEIECRDSTRERILTRAYGVPTQYMSAAFPLFNGDVHVIPFSRFESIIADEPHSLYQFVDPCAGRNWFMIWVACTRTAKFVYREWPSYGHEGAYVPGVGIMGEWSTPSNAADGAKGPAQHELGWSLLRYKEEIARLEEGEQIAERWIDARYANQRRVTAEESTTLTEELHEIGMNYLAAPSEAKLFNDSSDGSLRLINDSLYYNRDEPLSSVNEPKLFVCDTCPNTIYSLKTWTGMDGQRGASKDPIDCIRMLVLSRSEYVSEEMLAPKTPWMRQFA